MSTQQLEGQLANQDGQQGPGTQLAQARVDLKLSQEEVAARLHLATHQIQSLEADDYSGLPGSTYVRGYLRSYALLLGLEPEKVLKAHTVLTAKPQSPDFSTIAPQKQITSHHHQVRFVTYVVAILVIGLAIAWWQSRNTQLPSPLPVVQQDTVTPAAVTTDTATPPATEPVPVATAALPLVVKLPEPATVQSVTPPAVPVLPPNAPRVRFVLHADQDAWVDIRDARHAKLLYETVPAGRSVPLEGVAPVNVFLGNAAATRIEVNGESVDIERHRRGVFARFTLGESATAPAR
jgi:cytoskeleton protein RodZ